MAEQVLTEWVAFGRETRRQRELAGITLGQLAKAIGYGSSTISKIERATRPPKRDYVTAIESVFGTNGDLLRRWSDAKKSADDPDWYRKSVTSEEQANQIRVWHPNLIPGFLQIADYARVIFRDGSPFDTPEQIEQLVALRVGRLEALQQGQNPRILAIISERAIRNIVCSPDVMESQIKHLIALSESGAVQTLIVPMNSPYHGGDSGPLKILGFTERASLVYAEHASGGELITNPEWVARLEMILSDLQTWALPPSASRELMKEAIEGMR
ncbi:helix-turn-helix transcriptional regulator [Nocardiopsis tropica]|uniref:Helix-turn-helix transcriptional regulator n=1 Tax=Nocardiopsis tropica TaxID=109330 RepID=A0ABU7KMY3_9ACTN|nr:helix-turn-helix transcriptional regulator [Nocardiopsis umidischolae]MEE2050648.1 helix-turn-helix transcriptional regulator [Nocardiopsis umidischolae]